MEGDDVRGSPRFYTATVRWRMASFSWAHGIPERQTSCLWTDASADEPCEIKQKNILRSY